jgi:hypothetical protein
MRTRRERSNKTNPATRGKKKRTSKNKIALPIRQNRLGLNRTRKKKFPPYP